MILLLLLSVPIYYFTRSWLLKENARNVLIPEIQKLAADNGILVPSKAFDLAKEAEKNIPGDSNLSKLWPEVSNSVTFQTIPSGADVYWKDYNDVNGPWKFVGKTPLNNVRIPMGWPRIKIELAGYNSVLSPELFLKDTLGLKLDKAGEIPQNMVKVPGAVSDMLIVGLEKYEGKFVDEFLMDKYEVTNKEFKRFVDAGGYQDKKFWKYSVIVNGTELSWDKAMENLS